MFTCNRSLVIIASIIVSMLFTGCSTTSQFLRKLPDGAYSLDDRTLVPKQLNEEIAKALNQDKLYIWNDEIEGKQYAIWPGKPYEQIESPSLTCRRYTIKIISYNTLHEHLTKQVACKNNEKWKPYHQTQIED